MEEEYSGLIDRDFNYRSSFRQMVQITTYQIGFLFPPHIPQPALRQDRAYFLAKKMISKLGVKIRSNSAWSSMISLPFRKDERR